MKQTEKAHNNKQWGKIEDKNLNHTSRLAKRGGVEVDFMG
jgi:hypothetical protein